MNVINFDFEGARHARLIDATAEMHDLAMLEPSHPTRDRLLALNDEARSLIESIYR